MYHIIRNTRTEKVNVLERYFRVYFLSFVIRQKSNYSGTINSISH